MDEHEKQARREQWLTMARICMATANQCREGLGISVDSAGSEIDLLFVALQIAIGHNHDRMTASAVAAALGMSRTTVKRRFDELERRKLINRNDDDVYSLSLDVINRGDTPDDLLDRFRPDSKPAARKSRRRPISGETARLTARLAVGRLLVDLAKEMFNTWLPDPSRAPKPFGGSIELLFVAVCVLIGEFESRSMTVTAIARDIDMPRSTVRDKLDELIMYGVLQKKGTIYTLVNRSRPASYTAGHLDRVEALIQATLTKMGRKS